MANTIVSHPAQKLKIKHIKGSHFKLVVNIKNADGTNYDFTSNPNVSTELDAGIFRLVDASGTPPLNVLFEGQTANFSLVNAITVEVEDGKLTIEFTNNMQVFSPPAGTYKYHVSTTDFYNKQTVWLYGDFIVKDVNIYSNQDV